MSNPIGMDRANLALKTLGFQGRFLHALGQPNILTAFVEVEINVDLQEINGIPDLAVPTFLYGRMMDWIGMNAFKVKE